MAGAGYDISLGLSGSSSAGANQNSAFGTGGGGGGNSYYASAGMNLKGVLLIVAAAFAAGLLFVFFTKKL